MLKVCFIGLGSIGNRHKDNLMNICNINGIELSIDVLSSNKQKIYTDVQNIYYSFSELPNDYDAMFICNPTFMHYQTIMETKGKAKFFFVEKPIFNSYDENLPKILIENKSRYYVAAPLRYTNVIQWIKRNLNLEKVYSTRSICSSYLPDWRPGTDYRKVYSALKNEGGGVIIDLIHEWDYISYLFGMPSEIKGLYGTFSDLEIDSEDLAIYISKFKTMLCEVHLDYFGRVPNRKIELYLKDDVVVGDLNNNCIEFLKSNKKLNFNENINDRYIKEMEYFLDIVFKDAENNNDIVHANEVLALAQSIERRNVSD